MVFDNDKNKLELVAENLSFPTSLTFDQKGTAYIAESGLPVGGARPGGRIWALTPGEDRSLIAEGLRQPVNGVTFHDGRLYASEGVHPARISRVELDGRQTTILDKPPR